MAVTINGTTGIITPDIGVDGTTLTVDSVNNRIGIGTDNPSSTFVVRGDDLTKAIRFQTNTSTQSSMLFQNSTTGYGSNDGFYLGIDQEEDGYLWHFESENLIFGTSNTEKLRITSGGNLGVGNDGSFPIYTGTNDRTLILGTGEDSAIQIHSGTSNYGGLYFGDDPSGSNRYRGYVEFKHGTNDDFLRFGTGATERLRIDSLGSAQFKGQNAPSGRDTRISQYGSLLVATTGELISNARCSIDSGNGNITTAGEINVGGYNGGSNTTDGVLLGAVGGVYSQLSASVSSSGVLWQGMYGSTFTSRITADGAVTFAGGSFAIASDGDISTNVRCHGHIELDSTGSFSSPKIKLFSNTGSITAASVNLQSSATSSWFQTGTSIASSNYVWAAKNSSSNTWHSGLQTDGDLYLGGNLASSNNIALNGSNGSAWFSGGVGIGGYASSNTIDKYEEGSYTPKIYAGTGTTEPSYNWRYGQYVRIGEVVHVWGAMGISGSLPSCTSVYIGNLPYSQSYDSTGFFYYVQLHGYTWASGYGDSGSSTRLFLQSYNGDGTKLQMVNGSSKNLVNHGMIGSGQRFTFQFSYVVG